MASAVEDFNPLSIFKSATHDISVYVLNSCRNLCDFCGCWRFGFQTFETHDDKSEDGASINIAWH